MGIFTQISLRKKLNQKEEKEDSMNKVNVLRGPYSRLGNQETPLVRGTFKSKAPLRVQLLPALGGRGWEMVKAEASPRLY